MGTWIQDYIKTYDAQPFINYMCQQLANSGCFAAAIAKAGGGGYSNSFLLMGG